MAVVSFLQLISIFLFIICCFVGQSQCYVDRQRRQILNPNGLLSSNNRNDDNLSPSQRNLPLVRSGGYYSSSNFKPPQFSGEKPVGWFDTKYPNWLSNQNDLVDGNNAPPSNLQGKQIQSRKEDNGELFLEKIAKNYVGRGEKSFNIAQMTSVRGRGSICTNNQNFGGYVFGRFPCPLPINTGMSQVDQFCCGPINRQYCCNAQEFNQYQYNNDVNVGKRRRWKHLHHSPTTRRTLAVVLPIIILFVVAAALAVVFLYYKKVRNGQNKGGKLSGLTRLNDNYSAVPQNPPVVKTLNIDDERENPIVQT